MRQVSLLNKLLPVVAMAMLANIACKKNKIEEPSTPVAAKVVDFTICGAMFMDSSMTFCADASLDGEAVEWNFGDGTRSTEHKPTHVYIDTGTYNITLAVASGKVGEAKKTIKLSSYSPYTKTVCHAWLCDQSYYYTLPWPSTDTTVYTSNVSLEVTYENPGAIRINGDILNYDRVGSTYGAVKYGVKGSYSERALYYYPANDSIKYFNMNRTSFSDYNITTLYSKK